MIVSLPPVPPIVAPDPAPGARGPASVAKGRYWCLTVKEPGKKARSLGCLLVKGSAPPPAVLPPDLT